jgi:hypothetical protein
VSVVQGLSSLQFLPVPVHLPVTHLSFTEQAFPSSHVTLSGLLALTQPVAALQLSSVQLLLSLQLSAAPDRHAPDWHVSSCVHALLSVQVVPLGCAESAGHANAPLHVSARSHCARAPRQTVVAGAAWLKSQTPPTQRSIVHGLLSLQAAQAAAPTPH